MRAPNGIAADKGSRDKPEFYVRRGSSTYPAQPGELREAARTRPALNVNPGRRIPYGPGKRTHRQPSPEPREKAACSDG